MHNNVHNNNNNNTEVYQKVLHKQIQDPSDNDNNQPACSQVAGAGKQTE